MRLYKWIAQNSDRYEDCADSIEYIQEKIQNHLPSGSGFNDGTRIFYASRKKIVFQTAYQHMKNGYYTKWTAHTITIESCLALEYTMKISGPNHDGIKEYIADVFDQMLNLNISVMSPDRLLDHPNDR